MVYGNALPGVATTSTSWEKAIPASQKEHFDNLKKLEDSFFKAMSGKN